MRWQGKNKGYPSSLNLFRTLNRLLFFNLVLLKSYPDFCFKPFLIQLTMTRSSTVLMVRPAAFDFNDQTAENNFFQHKPALSANEIQKTVQQEFDTAVAKLKDAGIEVVVVEDTNEPAKPDAIFPNNWFCTMPQKSIQIFPLYAENRRPERRQEIVKQLVELTDSGTVDDWSTYEAAGVYLEGTGSMVFDHDNSLAYATHSERTDPELFKKFCRASGYTPFLFHASDEQEQPIYHTNVIFCMGEGFAILCKEAIEDADERAELVARLEESEREVISITRQQAKAFAGNMLQLENNREEPVLVMSAAAENSLGDEIKKTVYIEN